MSLSAYTIKNSDGDTVPLLNNYIATGYLTWTVITDNGTPAPTPSAPTQGSMIDGWNAPSYIASFPSINIALSPSTMSMKNSPTHVPGFHFANEGIYEITLNFAFGYATQNGSFPTTTLNWDQYFALSTSPTELISPGVIPSTGGFGFFGYTSGGIPTDTAIIYQNLSGNAGNSTYNINQRTYGPALYYQFQGQYNNNTCQLNTYTFTATIYANAGTSLYPLMKLANTTTTSDTNNVYMQSASSKTPYYMPFTCELIKSGTLFA